MNPFISTKNLLIKSAGLVTLLASVEAGQVQAQCGYATGLGCPGTDYANFGFNSNNDAATIEYDNFISVFHSSVVRDANGNFQIWGQNTAPTGAGNQTAKTEINVANYTNLTGTPLKAAMGSNNQAGYIILTTTGLHGGGTRSTSGVLANSPDIAPNTNNFDKLTIDGVSNGLPAGVNPTDVKMMFATQGTLAIVTCGGAAYVLSQNSAMRGNGGSGVVYTWYQVQTNATGNPFLTNVIALRGTTGAMIALTSTGELYTWGPRTYLGNNSGQASLDYATPMTLPKTGTIKMIGATHSASLSSPTRTGGTSYYVLYADGELYSLGNNNMRQLGNWPTGANPTAATDYPLYANSEVWVQPSYPNATNDGAGAVMDNIKWISPNEHDGAGNACINIINADGELWNWGSNSGNSLGRQPTGNSNTAGAFPYHPGQPLPSASQTSHGNFDPEDSHILAVETGGHTTLNITKCESNFGYVGHAINGSAANSLNTNYGTYTYSGTASVDVCGAEAVAAINYIVSPLQGSGGTVCAGQTLTLSTIPPGGTLTVVSGPGVLNGNTLSFTATTGTVILSYSVTTDCGPQSITDTLELENCPLQQVTGTVWIDNNENAVFNTPVEHGSNGATSNNGGLWATLVDNTGEAVYSVPVNPDGTYSIPLLQSTTGTFDVVITSSQIASGTSIPSSAVTLPAGWLYTGNNDFSNTPCVVPTCTDPHQITGIVLSGSGSSGNDFGIKGGYTVSGNIYHDANGLNGGTPAVDGSNINAGTSPYTTQSQPPLYISVIDVNGNVIHYVPVNNDGSYTIDIPLNEDVILQLTTTPGTIGSTSPPPTLPSTWTYAGEDFGTVNSEGSGVNDGTGTGSNAPSTRYDGRITVTFPGTSTTVTGVDFGIQQPPVADPKEYEVANSHFSTGIPAGFTHQTGYKAIAMSSPGLTGSGTTTYPTGGSLSGSDPEDCTGAGACNGTLGGTNASFIIGTINSNTRLFYDFGGSTGIQELSSDDTIPDFDFSKMVIYGQIGQGATGNELGFTYAIIDQAGVSSPFVTYELETMEPLPIVLINFDAFQRENTSELQWATSSEQNARGYEIERSANGHNWKTIGYVKSRAKNGFSNLRLEYSYIDDTPLDGHNYYRLKLIDIDGKYDYSSVRMVNFGKENNVVIYPNPAKDKVNISGLSGNETIRLFDITGRLVLTQKAKNTIEVISLDHLNENMIYINIEDAKGNITSYKLAKTK